jgi:hypothetical protein
MRLASFVAASAEQLRYRQCWCLSVFCSFDYIASVARHIYLRQGVGVGGLQKVYGGKRFVVTHNHDHPYVKKCFH